jgi:hypothetical protein
MATRRKLGEAFAFVKIGKAHGALVAETVVVIFPAVLFGNIVTQMPTTTCSTASSIRNLWDSIQRLTGHATRRFRAVRLRRRFLNRFAVFALREKTSPARAWRRTARPTSFRLERQCIRCNR